MLKTKLDPTRGGRERYGPERGGVNFSREERGSKRGSRGEKAKKGAWGVKKMCRSRKKLREPEGRKKAPIANWRKKRMHWKREVG